MNRSSIALCVVALASCQDAAPASTDAPMAIELAGPTVQLELGERQGDVVEVLVGYNRRAEQIGPRAVELVLDITPASFVLESSKRLDAATHADKQLVVQPQGSALRVILYSTGNLEALDTGWLASLKLRRTSPAAATLSLRNVGETFAPAEANSGFVPPEPITLVGGAQ